MIAVGIDVSKSKSTVAILNADGSQLVRPFNMAHTLPEMNSFVERLKTLEGSITIFMEYTGHYHYLVLKKLQSEGYPVCLINPYQIKKYGDVEIHKAKTDNRKDAIRIATYALEKAYKLTPYSAMEQKYEDLRFLSCQYGQRIADVSHLKTQLLDHLDQTMPGITGLLSLKSRTPEKCTLLLFIKCFKSFDEVCCIGKTRFLSAYATLVNKASDRFAASKALALYELAQTSITTCGDDPYIWSVQAQRVDVLAAQNAADEIILQMQNIAETLPEYKVLRAMHDVGDRLGLIILAEIGDIRRFHSAKALNSYAGSDASPYQSGQFQSMVATSPNVATMPSEKLALKSCGPIN